MALNDMVRRGAVRGAQRIVLHGPEGIGKTTFAAGAPGPIFMGTEDGFGYLDVARLPSPRTWPELLGYVEQLTKEPHDFRTVVIDTLDHLERLVWEYVRSEYRKKTIEEVGGGFGKGYTYAAEEFGRLADALDTLRDRRKMHVIALTHSHVKTFNNPDGTNYDRYELRMQKLAAALWKEWPDVLLFANWDVKVATSEWREDKALLAKGKAADAGKRRIYTTRAPSHDAKNRWTLPEELDLSWGAFAKAMKFDEIEGRLTKPAPGKSEAKPTAKADSKPEPAFDFAAAAAELGYRPEAIDAYLISKQAKPATLGTADYQRNVLERLQKPEAAHNFAEWLIASAASATPAYDGSLEGFGVAAARLSLQLDGPTGLRAYCAAQGKPTIEQHTGSGRIALLGTDSLERIREWAAETSAMQAEAK